MCMIVSSHRGTRARWTTGDGVRYDGTRGSRCTGPASVRPSVNRARASNKHAGNVAPCFPGGFGGDPVRRAYAKHRARHVALAHSSVAAGTAATKPIKPGRCGEISRELSARGVLSVAAVVIRHRPPADFHQRPPLHRQCAPSPSATRSFNAAIKSSSEAGDKG